MELNIINETFNTKRGLLNKNYEQPVETAITLPEYYPEIEKIISCKGEAYISSKAIEGNSLILNGTVGITMVYNDAEEKINAYNTSMPFSKKIDLNLTEISFSVLAKAVISYFNYKATSPKRVDIHGAINIPVEIFANDRCEVIEKIEQESLETRQATVKGNRFVNVIEQNVFIEEEFSIENDRPAIKCVLKVIKDCRVESCKIISNKAIVKGTLYCKIVYCSDENQIEKAEIEIPFNQIIDFDGLNENCSCLADLQLCGFDIETKTNYEGEIRTLIITATVCVSLEAYENNEANFLADAYSTKYESEVEAKEIKLDSLIDEVEEVFVCKKNIEYFEEIMRIESCWGEVVNYSLQIENGQIKIWGNILICAIARDSNQRCRFIERTIDFDWSKEQGEQRDDLLIKCCLKMPGISCSILGEGLEVKAELVAACRIFKQDTIKCISAVNVFEEKPIKNLDSIGAVLYFAKSGDKIWDIAKEHNTAQELIREYNALAGDEVEEDIALLLPLV